MPTVVTLNVNGLRSATRKGVLDWLNQTSPDFVCLQEVKAQADDLTEDMRAPAGYQGYFHFAEKKGYSGTAVYAKKAPLQVITGFGEAEFDREGRYTEIIYSNVSIVSVYFPSGSASEERQASKFRFLSAFVAQLERLRKSGREVLLSGDVNIAHTEKDLKNWKGNLKNSGFLPEERQWLSDMLASGWVDVYRHLYPDASDEGYTWWSNRGQAYAKNVGWRIDYQFATPALAATARSAAIYKEVRFSDHAPLIIDYAGEF